MKRAITLATILTLLVVITPMTHAAGQQVASVSQQEVSDVQLTTGANTSERQGFFSKLWELEKRKNAAILRWLRLKK